MTSQQLREEMDANEYEEFLSYSKSRRELMEESWD